MKSKLFAIIQSQNITCRYIVDEMAKREGHEVVRLPVAHCTLNPIKLAWAQVKGHIKSNSHIFNLAECERLAWEGFDIVTPERWKALVRHVKEKVEDHYWKEDGLTNHYVIGDFTTVSVVDPMILMRLTQATILSPQTLTPIILWLTKTELHINNCNNYYNKLICKIMSNNVK